MSSAAHWGVGTGIRTAIRVAIWAAALWTGGGLGSPRALGQVANPGAPSGAPRSPTVEVRDPQRVLAEGGGVRITVGDVASVMRARAPALLADLADPARLEALVDGLVRDSLLAAEAQRAGIDRDPRVRFEIARLLARALIERELAAIDAVPVTGPEIDAFYAAHLSELTRPERARVSVIVMESRSEAVRVASRMRAERGRRWRQTLRRLSIDRRSRSRDGDLGAIERAGLFAPIAEAALSLPRVGDIVAEPIELEPGRFYVVRLVERIAPEVIPLSSLRASLASRIRAERRAVAEASLIARLAGRAQLRRDRVGVGLVVDPGDYAPTVVPASPPPAATAPPPSLP